MQPDLFAPPIVVIYGDDGTDSDEMRRRMALAMQPLPRARSTDPATSHSAARSVRPGVRAAQYAQIAYALRYGGPATAHELADKCRGQNQYTISRCLPEMRALGQVADSGQVRMGPSGRPCTVWESAG
jgi:hypothetical protein